MDKRICNGILRALGVNEKFGNDNIHSVAVQCRSIPNFDEDNLFDYINYPVMWTSGLSLRQCIDTPMHQLFQGIVKSIFEITSDWLTRKVGNHFSKFCAGINDTLLNFHELGLDWCRMEKLIKGRTYTTGGWQAEQFIAFSRCTMIIYSSIRDIVGNDETGIDEHEFMRQSLSCFLSRVMNADVTDETLQMHYIKTFLSSFDLFENVAYLMEDADPMWFKRGNFLSLLNLPSQIKEFGGLRHYWEGSRERTIQQIKPFLISMRSSSLYYKTKLTRMYITQSLQNLQDDHMDPELLQETKYDRILSFKVYSHNVDFDALISDRKVFSIIVMQSQSQDLQYLLCKRLQQSKLCQLIPVQFQDNLGFNKCGLWYAPLSFDDTVPLTNLSRARVNKMATDYAVLCPCISSVDDLNICYTVFTRNWKYRIAPNILSHPTLSFNFIQWIIGENKKRQEKRAAMLNTI